MNGDQAAYAEDGRGVRLTSFVPQRCTFLSSPGNTGKGVSGMTHSWVGEKERRRVGKIYLSFLRLVMITAT
jgi:hypothetical protein